MRIPDTSGDWHNVYTDFKCRNFPKSVSDHCDEENRLFCAEWTSAGYSAQLGIGFGILALIALLFGVSTHSRRRRVWIAVAGLITLNGTSPDFYHDCSLNCLLPPVPSALFYDHIHYRD